MFQQLLANKHHRLRDSVPSTIWPSGGLVLVTDKKKKTKKNKSRLKQEPPSAHGRVVNHSQLSYGLQLALRSRMGQKKREEKGGGRRGPRLFSARFTDC